MANILGKIFGGIGNVASTAASATPIDVAGNVVAGIGNIIDQFHMSPEEKAQADQFKLLLSAHADEAQQAYQIQLATINEQDRASARVRQTVVKDWTPTLLALLSVGCFVAFSFDLVFRQHANSLSEAILGAILGYLAANCQSVMNYYFGSSSGSAAKTEQIGQVLQQNGKK